MMLRPLDDIIYVEMDTPEEITKGGIILPEIAQVQLDQGTIIACGPGKKLDNGDRMQMESKPGDKILFTKYAKLEFKLQGKTLFCCHESDIIGIIEE